VNSKFLGRLHFTSDLMSVVFTSFGLVLHKIGVNRQWISPSFWAHYTFGWIFMFCSPALGTP
jgi:hypothetical protein